MEFLSYLVLAGLVIYAIGLYGYTILEEKFPAVTNYNSMFSKTAEKYQCTFIKGNRLSSPKISGKIDDVKIYVEKQGTEQEELLQIDLTFSSPLSGHFIIEEETTFSILKKTVGVEDILTGDKDFDKTMLISASHPSLIAVLFNKIEREKINRLKAETMDFMIGHNKISIWSELHKHKRTEYLTSKIDLVLSIAKNITRETDTKERLLDNLNIETEPAVIINIIKALTSQYSLDKEIKNSLKKVINHKSIAVQTEASQHLGSRGMQHLSAVLKEKESPSISLEIKIIDILGQNNYSKPIPLLKKEYFETTDSKKQLAILRAFKKFENAKVEPFLLEQLYSKETDLRHASIEALGTCGTTASAEKLYLLAKDSMNPFTKNYAQKAIGQIQSRLGNVDKGWLSISDSPKAEGALSISDNSTEGALSLDKKNKKKTDHETPGLSTHPAFIYTVSLQRA